MRPPRYTSPNSLDPRPGLPCLASGLPIKPLPANLPRAEDSIRTAWGRRGPRAELGRTPSAVGQRVEAG